MIHFFGGLSGVERNEVILGDKRELERAENIFVNNSPGPILDRCRLCKYYTSPDTYPRDLTLHSSYAGASTLPYLIFSEMLWSLFNVYLNTCYCLILIK